MLVKSQVKYIQSLGQKKPRDESGVFIAEGPKIVSELLQEIPGQVQQVLGLEEWLTDHSKLLNGIETIEVSPAELDKISQLQTPNQVLAVLRKFEQVTEIKLKGNLILALDTLQDPGNLGTIIRIADWFGIEYIICDQDSADLYNPKVVQATMGSICRVKLLYTDLAGWLAEQKTTIYAASLEGEDITTMQKPAEGIIIIGNESKGISPGILKLVTKKITIPQKGKAESLNAAVATGIILSHLTT
ncbi:MAG: RNA methyltransferase [Chitinophagales bacterium]|nr:RNA methyltransferase [Chitinophagales bacterium]